MPYPLAFHRMVANQGSKAVYVTGGEGRKNNGEIIELQCSGFTPNTCAFKPSAIASKVNRDGHTALPITEFLANKICT